MAQETCASWPRKPLHRFSRSLYIEGMFQALPQTCWLRLSEPVTGNIFKKLTDGSSMKVWVLPD